MFKPSIFCCVHFIQYHTSQLQFERIFADKTSDDFATTFSQLPTFLSDFILCSDDPNPANDTPPSNAESDESASDSEREEEKQFEYNTLRNSGDDNRDPLDSHEMKIDFAETSAWDEIVDALPPGHDDPAKSFSVCQYLSIL